MSEHYDFHYQPTGSGAISGQQVLEQTEDAINELGDYVNDNVGGAMDVAQQALETAQNAEQDAQTALDTANSFSSAIQSAQQDASTALSTAQTAQTTASNANNTAIQAQQDASSAVTTANNASGQVSTLSGTVTALGQRVTTAEGNIGQNTSDITALTTRVGTAEGNITTLQNDVTIAQGNASSAMATAGTVKQQAFVFRYSSTALVASSTNSNTLLDNTDNLKVGDKVIDSSGVLFSITAIDTANSTFTVGTALIDLAQDSDVVHKSGDETISGTKSFPDGIVANITGSATSATYDGSGNVVSSTYGKLGATNEWAGTNTFKQNITYEKTNFFHQVVNPSYILKDTELEKGSLASTHASYPGLWHDKNSNILGYMRFVEYSSGRQTAEFRVSNLIKNGALDPTGSEVNCTVDLELQPSGEKSLIPEQNNDINLGTATKKWKSFNGVEPSSLSLPDLANKIDISSYITDLTGGPNNYISPSNGYINLRSTNADILGIVENTSGMGTINRGNNQTIAVYLPVVAGSSISLYAKCTSLAQAYFIPCQGNV